MSSEAKRRRLNLAADVAALGVPNSPCSQCRNSKGKRCAKTVHCVVGPQSRRCSECIRKGYANCDVASSSSQSTQSPSQQDQLREALDATNDEEVRLLQLQQEILQRLAQNKAKQIELRKQLRLASDTSIGSPDVETWIKSDAAWIDTTTAVGGSHFDDSAPVAAPTADDMSAVDWIPFRDIWPQLQVSECMGFSTESDCL